MHVLSMSDFGIIDHYLSVWLTLTARETERATLCSL